MVNRRIITFIIIYISFFSCQTDKPADVEVEEMSQAAEELSQSFTERIPQMTDDFKVSIYELQERIKINPENKDLRKQFCEAAYSNEKMVMVTMGIARLKNQENDEPINRGMVERAAKIDATRWALYGTNWLMYDYEPAFTEIKGNFTRKIQVIDKVVVGDSLFLYLASDLSQ
jgi:hypothetical protein